MTDRKGGGGTMTQRERVMQALAAADQPLSARQVADAVQADPSVVRRLLRKAVERGEVARVVDQTAQGPHTRVRFKLPGGGGGTPGGGGHR